MMIQSILNFLEEYKGLILENHMILATNNSTYEGYGNGILPQLVSTQEEL